MNIVNIILGVSLIIFGGLVLLGAPLMYLLNYVVPSLFGLRYITFWEAVGLNLITGILFRQSILPFEAFNKIKNKIS